MKSPKQLAREKRWLMDEKYHGRLTSQARRDIERLEQGEPVDYVIGFVDFLGSKIDLSRNPFIPRAETEYWVDSVLNEMAENGREKGRCLDIFAGSGCIGLSVLKRLSEAKVDFAEINEIFLAQIKVSAEINDISPDRYRLIRSDIFGEISGEYDYILANPPYVAAKDKIESAVAKYEPRGAWLAGEDGLDVIKKFLAEARKFLTRGGKLYMELDPRQKEATERILKAGGYRNYRFERDQYQRVRFVIATT